MPLACAAVIHIVEIRQTDYVSQFMGYCTDLITGLGESGILNGLSHGDVVTDVFAVDSDAVWYAPLVRPYAGSILIADIRGFITGYDEQDAELTGGNGTVAIGVVRCKIDIVAGCLESGLKSRYERSVGIRVAPVFVGGRGQIYMDYAVVGIVVYIGVSADVVGGGFGACEYLMLRNAPALSEAAAEKVSGNF